MVWSLEQPAHQRQEIARAQPGGKHAPVLRLREATAYSETSRLQAEFVEVKPGKILAEALADAVQAVRPTGSHVVKRLADAVESGHMIGACEDDAADARLSCPLVQIVGAEDVGLRQPVEIGFDGDRAKVQDRIAATRKFLDGLPVGEVAPDHFLAIVGRAKIGDIR